MRFESFAQEDTLQGPRVEKIIKVSCPGAGVKYTQFTLKVSVLSIEFQSVSTVKCLSQFKIGFFFFAQEGPFSQAASDWTVARLKDEMLKKVRARGLLRGVRDEEVYLAISSDAELHPESFVLDPFSDDQIAGPMIKVRGRESVCVWCVFVLARWFHASGDCLFLIHKGSVVRAGDITPSPSALFLPLPGAVRDADSGRRDRGG